MKRFISRVNSLCFLRLDVIQCRTILQPRNLTLVIRMIQLRLPHTPISSPHPHCQLLTRLDFVNSQNIHSIIHPNPAISLIVRKGQRKHPLLLQISLMDAREAIRHDGYTVQVARLERRVFTAGSFAVIILANDAPADARRLVLLGHFGHGSGRMGRASEVNGVAAADGRVVEEEGVFGADEKVVGDIFKMAAVVIPGAGRGYMVCRAFSCARKSVELWYVDEGGHQRLTFHFEQDSQVLCITGLPAFEGLEELELVTFWVYNDLECSPVLCRGLVEVRPALERWR
ncbi:hypothetical protein MPH_05542 [Macrophomina phaseolina MS6]|uniref:Uncharacterized protein n=1 Tax=Macrophomina phaseolina (strain MS6) TaxID=1126212 RepID=K2RX00_MACPH|nr:hypothetical protein MPH_05542 [Macrophomina phaseolina MS6]